MFRTSSLVLTVRLWATVDSRCRRARSSRYEILSSKRQPFPTGSPHTNLPVVLHLHPVVFATASRSSSGSWEIAVGLAALTILCEKPPIRTVDLFIFVICMRDASRFLSLYAKKKRDLPSLSSRCAQMLQMRMYCVRERWR